MNFKYDLVPEDGFSVGDSVGIVIAAVEIGMVLVFRIGTAVPGKFICVEVRVAMVGTALEAVTAWVDCVGVGRVLVDIRVCVGVVPTVKKKTFSHTHLETDLHIDRMNCNGFRPPKSHYMDNGWRSQFCFHPKKEISYMDNGWRSQLAI